MTIRDGQAFRFAASLTLVSLLLACPTDEEDGADSGSDPMIDATADVGEDVQGTSDLDLTDEEVQGTSDLDLTGEDVQGTSDLDLTDEEVQGMSDLDLTGEDGSEQPEGPTCFIDFPCFALQGGGQGCDPNDATQIISYESRPCSDYCGSEPCSGGACESEVGSCTEDTVCIAGEMGGACESLEFACGGPNDLACPEGKVCTYSTFHSNGGIYAEDSCYVYDQDMYGRCGELLADCDDTPVCGCDGVTYDNACAASEAGVAIDLEGTACAAD